MSTWMPTLALRAPLWLLIVPAIVALHLLLLRRSPPLSRQVSAYAERHLLRWLIIGAGTRPRSWLNLLAWCLIAVAASGPYLADPKTEAARRGLNIALVIDISPSMATTDVPPDRLGRARLEARDFLNRLQADRITLIAFSAYAYRVLPLTNDLPLVSSYIDALEPGLTRRQGSNLVQALELASQSLPAETRRGNAIVVLSDGEADDEAAVLQAAARLKAREIPVFALGIGTTAGAPVPAANGYARRADGELAVSRLDRELLQKLASGSGGGYSDARSDDEDWNALFAGLHGLGRDRLAAGAAPMGVPLFPWILAAGLVFALWARCRPPRLAAVMIIAPLIAMALTASPARAAPWSERAAYEALKTGRYDEAAALYRGVDGYEGWLGRGAAAYRKGEWPEALVAFTQAERLADDTEARAKALYNRATTLARLERLEDALGDLDQVLRLSPNHARAALNRELILRTMKARELPAEGTAPRLVPTAPVSRTGGEQQDARAHSPAVAKAGPAGGRPDSATPDANAELPGGEEPPTAVTRSVALSAAARSALAGLRSLSDDPREVLRHRFMVMDATHPGGTEDRPW